MAFARPELVPYARFDIAGAELIPKEGPAIVVGNHRSYFDATAMSILFGRAGRTVRFLGKKEVFDAPVVGLGGESLRGHPRRSGHRERRAPARSGRRARSRPGRGDHAAGHHPARPGLLRPCAEGALGRRPPGAPHQGTGHPGRPVGHREGVAPQQPAAERASTSPTRRSCAVRVGSPVALKYASVAKDTERIMAAIVDLLPPEAHERHEPTAAGAGPHLSTGLQGRPGRRKRERRPGTD